MNWSHTLRRLFGSVLMVCGLAACGEVSPPALRLGTILWPGYEPIYLAREQGLLDPDRVVLVEYVNSNDVLRGMLNDVLDAGALTMDEALSLASQRGDNEYVIFHVADISHGGDAILARPPIDAFEQLRGKRVGFEITALGSYFLDRALAGTSLARGEFTAVNLEMDNQLGAWERGEVDALVTFEPLLTRVRQQGGNVLFSSADIPGEIVDLMVVRREVLEQRPEVLAHLVSAWFEAVHTLETDPDTALPILDQRLRLGEQGVRQALSGLKIPDRSAVANLITGSEPELKQALQRMQDVMEKAGLLQRRVDVSALFSATLPGINEP